MVVCCNTFQFLGGKDIMLPALNYFILKIKTANFKNIGKPATRMQCQCKKLEIQLFSVIITSVCAIHRL
jgi:hypothetical protein